MIIDQYKPQEPQAGNDLHALTLLRMQARKDADAAYERLNKRSRNLFVPNTQKSGLLGMLFSNVPTILTGITVGRKIVEALRK